MNEQEGMALEQARMIGQEAMRLMEDVAEEVIIAGSVRREKKWVKDLELVVVPREGWWARLDGLVAKGRIEKAMYGQAPRQTQRWGTKYRGFVFQGLRIECFAADRDNLGYILWLRTGPGDANAYVMQRLLRSPISAQDGYLHYRGRKLSVGNEAQVFGLLGMGWVHPQQRSEGLYRQELDLGALKTDSLVYAAAVETTKPQQGRMF